MDHGWADRVRLLSPRLDHGSPCQLCRILVNGGAVRIVLENLVYLHFCLFLSYVGSYHCVNHIEGRQQYQYPRPGLPAGLQVIYITK